MQLFSFLIVFLLVIVPDMKSVAKRHLWHTFLFTLFVLLGFIVPSHAQQITTPEGKVISFREMDSFLVSQMDTLGMPGLSIAFINNGKVVYHKAIGVTNIATRTPVDDQSIFEAASLSKPLFAFFVMKTVEDGLLDLDRPLYKYLPFPELEYDRRYKWVTARMVLDHTTGFPNWRWFDPIDTALHLKIKRGDMYIKSNPGTFGYSGEGYYYLSKVMAQIHHLSLKNLDSLFQVQIAAPLGMEHAWFAWNDFLKTHKVSGHKGGKVSLKKWPVSFPDEDSSTFGSAGKLHTEALSYAAFLTGMMQHKVLSAASYNEMLKKRVSVPRKHEFNVNEGTSAWGLGIGIQKTKLGNRYVHGGNNGDFQSGCVFYMQPQYGYVYFTNCDKGYQFGKQLSRFLQEEKE